MIQNLESQTYQGIPTIRGRTFDKHRLFPLCAKILIWGLGKGPGICSHLFPHSQPSGLCLETTHHSAGIY